MSSNKVSDEDQLLQEKAFADCVSLSMLKRGLRLHIEKLGKSDIVIGIKVEWGGTQITYKVESDVLMITCYQRIKKTNTGLRSGFIDMFDWLSVVKDEAPQIKWVVGRVDPLSSAPSMSGLSLEQLNRFYSDIMHTPKAPDLGEKWYRYDIAQLQSIRSQIEQNKRSSNH